MRARLVAFSVVACLVTATTAFACGSGEDCVDTTSAVRPVVVYAAPPVLFGAPPLGYVLDPSDARLDLYIVNQGPVYDGPNIVTFPPPTYSESGYAYERPYPYVHFYTLGHGHHGYRGIRWRHPFADRSRGYPRYGYAYRPAASARVIDIETR
jgi:hypothetical protein